MARNKNKNKSANINKNFENKGSLTGNDTPDVETTVDEKTTENEVPVTPVNGTPSEDKSEENVVENTDTEQPVEQENAENNDEPVLEEKPELVKDTVEKANEGDNEPEVKEEPEPAEEPNELGETTIKFTATRHESSQIDAAAKQLLNNYKSLNNSPNSNSTEAEPEPESKDHTKSAEEPQEEVIIEGFAVILIEDENGVTRTDIQKHHLERVIRDGKDYEITEDQKVCYVGLYCSEQEARTKRKRLLSYGVKGTVGYLDLKDHNIDG